MNPTASNSLKIFASISEADNVTDLNYNVQNVALLSSAVSFPNSPAFVNFSYTTPIQYPSYIDITPWMGTAGATLSILHDRMQMSYNFEKRDFIGLTEFAIPGGGFLIRLGEFNTYAHRLGATAKLIDHST